MSDRVLSLEGRDVKISLGDHYLTFEFADFGKQYEEKAKKELRETPNIMEESTKALKKYILEETDLEFPIECEASLLTFLRPCKHYPESAWEKMRRYYTFKAKHPKYFSQLLPSKEKAAFMQSLLTVIPYRTKKGERVLIVEAGKKWSPKSCTLTNLVRSVIMILEAALVEPRTQVAGTQVILDVEGLSTQHVWQFGPTVAKDIVEFVQDCVPVRVKAVHITNQPYVFNVLFAIFKPFLNEKLRNRIHFHGNNFDNLHDFIGKDILPLKYDGTLNIPMDQGEQLHKFLSCFEPEFKAREHEGYTRNKK